MKRWLSVTAALALTAGIAHARPGQVLVLFHIDADKFKKGLNQATAEPEAQVAEKIATSLRDMFPPIAWTTTAPADGAAATLIASLQQDTSIIPNITLHWSAKVGDKDLKLHALKDWPIYESGVVDRPYRNAKKLVSDLSTKIDSWMASTNSESAIHDDFVRYVPLANTVALDPSIKAVLIPLPWDGAMIGEHSSFRLEFMRAQPLTEMTVVLGSVARRTSGNMLGDTQTFPAACLASNNSVPGNAWDACLSMFPPNAPPPMQVSFEHYEFSGRTRGTTPTGSSEAP